MLKCFLPALFLVSSLFLGGCSIYTAFDEHFIAPPEDTVQEIFEAANDAMKEKKYDAAAGYYSKIKDDFPFSEYAVEAELALGDAYFLDEKYSQAADTYQDFETLHPRHEAIPYVLYQAGVSLKKSYVSIDRSATEIDKALELFSRVSQEYGDTEYGKKAEEEIHECRKILAQREIFIGNVFWGMENYEAAWTRFQAVVRDYPDAVEEAEYAKTKGEAAFLKFRKTNSQYIREVKEGSWKDWFRWL